MALNELAEVETQDALHTYLSVNDELAVADALGRRDVGSSEPDGGRR